MTAILTIGAGQVARTIGWWTPWLIGCAWLIFLAFVLLIITVDAIRKPKAPDDQWLDDLIADIGICPWCQVRECTEPGKCTCDDPCGMRLCRALASEVAP